MKKDLLLIKNFLQEMRIPISEIAPPIGTNKEFPDLGLRSSLFGDDAPFQDALPSSAGSTPHKVFHLTDDYQCHYIFFQKNKRTDILVGPFLTEDMTMREISSFYHNDPHFSEVSHILRTYFNSVPKLRDEGCLEALLHAFCTVYFAGKNYVIEYANISPNLPSKHSEISPSSHNAHSVSVINERYSYEGIFLSCVEKGDYSGATQSLRHQAIYGPESRTPNSLRDLKNYSIVLNTLCRTASARGGVSPVDIDQCSREYSLKIENAPSKSDLADIRADMIRKYCKLVLECSSRNYDPLVQNVIDYLSKEYLNESISLKSTAKNMGVSPSYLSTIFKKQVGITYSEYVISLRLSYANSLLENTACTITEIATQCGFRNANYFSRAYRKNFGMTPRAYRKQL